MKLDATTKIVCTIAITIIKKWDETRTGHSQVIGGLSEQITALRLAGETSKEFKAAVIAAADLLKAQP